MTEKDLAEVERIIHSIVIDYNNLNCIELKVKYGYRVTMTDAIAQAILTWHKQEEVKLLRKLKKDSYWPSQKAVIQQAISKIEKGE